MKRLHTGLIVLDTLDIICISFSVGSGIAYLTKKYKKINKKIKRRGVDPLVTELKEKSPIIMFSGKGKPLKLPLVRGGAGLKGFSVMIKSKKLAFLIKAIVTARKQQKQLRLLRLFFLTFNALLTSSVGLRFAIGGSLNYTQFILIAFPSTISGSLIGLVTANPLPSVLLPLAIIYGRGIEDIPDPYQRCKAICKAAEEFHNKQLRIEMKKLNSLVEDVSDALQLPLDKVPLLCVEEKLSLLQRYKLREVIQSAKARKRVEHFSEFIKKFPECDANPEAVYEQIAEKIEKL